MNIYCFSFEKRDGKKYAVRGSNLAPTDTVRISQRLSPLPPAVTGGAWHNHNPQHPG